MTEISQASKIYIGGAQATKVYVGATQVWPQFRPTHLSGCRVWLDASKLGLAHGAAVSSWPNLGAGSQPTITGTPTPTYRTGALNSLPVVRITKLQGKYRFAGTGVDKDWTLIYVGRKWRATVGRVVAASASAANILVGFHGAEWDQCYVEGWLTPSTTTATTSWKLYSADSTVSDPARFYSNGTLLYSGAATPSLGWGGTLCLSGYDADEQEADCEIAELVMYSRRLSAPERQQVEGYLRTKWNVPTTMFKPTDLGANLVAWFDGADYSTLTFAGSGMSAWANKGVGGMTLAQATDAYRPTWTNAAVNIAMGQGLTPANAPATYDLILAATPNGIADWRTLMRSAQGHEMIIESGSTRFGVYSAGFQPAGALTWGTVEGIGFTRVAASAVTMMSRDGGAMTSTGTALAAASAATTMFGAYMPGSTPSQAFGRIKEVIIVPYNSESLRPQLEGYLAHRHGLTDLLPAGHPYKTTSP